MEKKEWPTINKKYKVHMKLGSGQQGQVVLATNIQTNERYAIKIYKKKQQKDYFQKYVMLEMGKLKDSKNEYIIRLEEILIDAIYVKPNQQVHQINAIVMEYASHGDFLQFIKLAGPFQDRVAKYYFKQLILGLNYLHNEQNICHRDLKPDNMLINDTFDLKICDLAMSASLSNTLTTQIGNVLYQAPEIHKMQVKDGEESSSGYNGRTADIFSAGVILYLMLTGAYPSFNTKNYTDSALEKAIQNIKIKMQQIQNSEEQSPQQAGNKNSKSPLSNEAVDLITQMLQKDPLNRISLAEIIIHPWLSQEQVDKKEVIQFMDERFKTYLQETRTEFKQKKTDQVDKEENTKNSGQLAYVGANKFRSDSNQHEKQMIALGQIEKLNLEQNPRNFKLYTEEEIGVHDYEFEINPNQNCIEQIKSILLFLYNENNIDDINVDKEFYKINFTVQDRESNQADVKISIKQNQNKKNVYLVSLTKNLGSKSLGLEVYKKIKRELE